MSLFKSQMLVGFVFVLLIVAWALEMFAKYLCDSIEPKCTNEERNKMVMASSIMVLVAAILVVGSMVNFSMSSKGPFGKRTLGSGFGEDLFGFEYA